MSEEQISDRAEQLTVNQEVSSPQVYEAKYRHPTWPGGASGVTVAVGYDLGYTTKAELWADWKGTVPDAMISAMERALGIHGDAAHALARSLHDAIDIPWGAADAVFRERDVPKWIANLQHALKNTDKLNGDSRGSLFSCAYNRGASFHAAGDRYIEMRNIADHMAACEFGKIPGELRSMKRLWPAVPGLQHRRDLEADLFEYGLRAPAPAPAVIVPVAPSIVPPAAPAVVPATAPIIVPHTVNTTPDAIPHPGTSGEPWSWAASFFENAAKALHGQ